MQMLQDLKNANNVQEEPQTQEPVPCPEHNDNTVVDIEPEEDKEPGDLMRDSGLSKKYRLQKLKRCIDHPDPSVALKALDQSWKLDGSYHDSNKYAVNMTAYNLTAIIEKIWDSMSGEAGRKRFVELLNSPQEGEITIK